MNSLCMNKVTIPFHFEPYTFLNMLYTSCTGSQNQNLYRKSEPEVKPEVLPEFRTGIKPEVRTGSCTAEVSTGRYSRVHTGIHRVKSYQLIGSSNHLK